MPQQNIPVHAGLHRARCMQGCTGCTVHAGLHRATRTSAPHDFRPILEAFSERASGSLADLADR